MKILVVDDSEIALESARRVLAAAGHEVVLRNLAHGTTAAILRLRPDLVLLDVSMPGLSGDSIVQVVRRRAGIQDTKVLLFSSRPQGELQRLTKACGADGFIRKTPDLKNLVSRIGEWDPNGSS